MITQLKEKIKNYLEKIKIFSYPSPGEQCRKCSNVHVEFKLHECRERKVRIIEDVFVKIETISLVRYKCSFCKGTFTVYPDFVLPNKRYATNTMIELSEKYLEKEKTSYENTVKEGEIKIGYEEDLGKKKNYETFLYGSTVKRWIVWFGKLESSISKALDMIRQKCPMTNIFREISPCSEKKYKNDEQRKILENAMMLLKVKKEYERIFGENFFPRFAIKLE